jgi:SutA RNAP-binding domain
VKKFPTKADLRIELQSQIDNYTRQGGEIDQVPRGLSGRVNPNESLQTPLFDGPKTNRTPIPEIVAALDSRRQTKAETKKPAEKRRREKIIYDDFGEPLRKVWVEE